MPPTPDEAPFVAPARRFSLAHIPQPVYLGLDVEVSEDLSSSIYSICVHDGAYTTDYYSGHLADHKEGLDKKECVREALEELKKVVKLFATSQHYKVQLIACSYLIAKQYIRDEDKPEHSAMSDFWREFDAIPFRVQTHGDTSDERASAAVRKAVMWISPQYPGNLPRISVGYRHEVEVDFNNIIHLVDLVDYKESVKAETWRVWSEISQVFKNRNLRVSFFNSTPQGGGVALMRHALLRFLNLNGIKVHWYVARPKPEVFDITKRKFHNVLQGVAAPNVRLTAEDKQTFIDWSNDNVNRFWGDEKGPLRNSDVIVIDDPQVCGIIPHIKRCSPNTRIIFRSHIEIRADLIRDYPDGPQAETWNFLWQFIKYADLFVAHPIQNFVPDVVPRRNVVLLPAATDPLDGLNKELTGWCVTYYRSVFNRICVDQGANEVDWKRPYITQVARFDPSKGIPDVLEAYRLLRERMDKEGVEEYRIPQLIICGHGSIDDPDGTIIYEQTHEVINSPPFASIATDIIAARLPACDQLLNMVLRGAHIALQLSHREGFEVKVTEAFQKGVPVIAYRAGGIPLQIREDVTGFLVTIGDVKGVANKLYELMQDRELHERMSSAALELLTEEYFTVWNATSWLFMCNELTNSRVCSEGLLDVENTYERNSRIGDSKKVCDFWIQKYNYNP
ncbi:uncharacterized protein BYT42DRAFT_555348 [Radiomyces spectabilis]|uniref:uncharacterized protein n=1 Tax=Radiomyces spectabilis TaxID=64574 RepID=UPI00221F82DB|nr:uncharacterized protein BYT42DRAFT_555348 [Radiomyces spectabilis]KAI8391035.1 hypothetical protein BYT42DRAFT_555348 [Radiomyces spectabilis]